ncbi:MAG: type II toxin-antitoxin system Phd/YefM family antitoxin [Tepidiformaceae bacterium]
MSSSVVSPAEASADLPALLARVERGEEIVIARDGAPVARIVPAGSSGRPPRPFGTAIGLIELLPGWDDDPS